MIHLRDKGLRFWAAVSIPDSQKVRKGSYTNDCHYGTIIGKSLALHPSILCVSPTLPFNICIYILFLIIYILIILIIINDIYIYNLGSKHFLAFMRYNLLAYMWFYLYNYHELEEANYFTWLKRKKKKEKIPTFSWSKTGRTK